MLVTPGQGREPEGAVRGTEQGFDAGLDERGERDGEFAHAQPADAARDVLVQRQRRHGLNGQIARQERVVAPSDLPCARMSVPRIQRPALAAGGISHARRHGRAPQQIADQVVLADIVGEEIDARAAVGGCGSQGVEVGAPEHVGFTDDAGGEGGGVNARVEFRVAGRLEHFFEAAAGEGEGAREECLGWMRWTGGGRGGRHVDDEG